MVATARKWRFSPPGTGEIIRDYLKGKGVGYPYDAWRYYKMCLRKIYPELIEVPGDKKTKKAEVVYHTADYSSFYRYFYILEELGLIERVKSEYGRAKIPRVYFKIVPEMKDSEAWYKPQVILYPQTGVGRKEWREIMRIAGEKGVSTRDIFAQDYRGEIEDSAEIMDVGADEAVATFSALGRLVPHVRPPKLKPEVEELKEKLRTCEIKLEACETDLERVTAEFEELKVP
ncbi:MAG: hypothetical protein QMD22_11055, partial [archaeon]|nr:hypothetical protein [archaeon]